MNNVEKAKIVGILGSVLILMDVLVHKFFITKIVGLLVVLLAIKYLANEAKEPKILKNYSIFAALTIAASVILILAVMFAVQLVLGVSGLEDILNNPANIVNLPEFQSAAWLFLSAFLIYSVLYILGSIFMYMSYKKISRLFKVRFFEFTAIANIVVAVLTLIMIGVLLTPIVAIFQMISFALLPKTPA
ncbi:MAG: DUF996 domain-containing protein [Archaeoglobaceae archaeon]|nr:DUF996 domain-containing protein [Archaeoglobaceae archaeon]MCX8151704.1 DUF996 domain-containing protein [Archaeoglobaceae archaeon]MDW8013018.1 DUF996 domain-containing protein [Archaeoglobaceae archaeon]